MSATWLVVLKSTSLFFVFVRLDPIVFLELASAIIGEKLSLLLKTRVVIIKLGAFVRTREFYLRKNECPLYLL